MIDDSQELMRKSIAASATFRTLVGAANQSEALERVYGDELPKPTNSTRHSLLELQELRPCAVVWIPSNNGWQVERNAAGDVASGDCWHSSGMLECAILRNVPEVDKNDPAKVDKDFRVTIGDIVSDLIASSETADRLACHKITVMGPYRTALDEMLAIGDAQSYNLQVEWGHR